MVLLELLAPAGSYDVFVTAVNAGADAVYIAGNQYGARAFAKNFSLKEIEKAVEYAHLNGVKVYVTVNTLINNFEIIDVMDYLFKLYKIGVDALIVQDLGIVYLLGMLIPDFEVHASTQMALNNYSSVKWAANNNIKRVVLPREININQIKQFKRKIQNDDLDMEIEVFGHGALCYSVSGNCYISSYNSGRSGNRGACAQPCRREYKLKYRGYNIGNGYLLSTHDLATYNNIGEIEDVGVNSLKLEGRMKSQDYVGTIVNSYRNIIDGIEGNYAKDLQLVFNRDFTDGYLMDEKPGDVMGRVASGHEGLYIGDIVDVDGTKVTIEIKNKENYIPLGIGDGIAFKYNGKIKGIYLDKIISQDEDKIVIDTTRLVKPGTEVFISYSKSIHENLKKFNKETIKQHIPLNIMIDFDKYNMIVKVEFYLDNELFNFKYVLNDFFQKAINKPLTKDNIIKQLSKTGETPFYIENIEINNMGENLFATISDLNNFRREIIKKASELLLNHYTPTKKSIKKTRKNLHEFIEKYKSEKNENINENPSLSIFVDNLDILNAASGFNLKRVYFDGNCLYNNRTDYYNNIQDILEKAALICSGSELVWVLSSFIDDEELSKAQKIIEKLQNKGIIISIMGDFPAMREIFNCPIYANHNLNIWNSFTVQSLAQSGFNGLILSNELSQDEIRELIKKNKTNVDLEMIINGNLEVIVTKDDFSNLNNGKDFIISNNSDYAILEDKKRKKFKYKVSFDYNKQSHIINKDCLCLIEEINNIKKLGLNNLILDFRYCNETYTKNILSLYNNALKDRNNEELNKYKYQIMDLSHCYINKGNFIKGRLHEDKNKKLKQKID